MKRITLRKRAATIVALLLLTLMVAAPASADHIDNPDFARTWERTDKPVVDGVVDRTQIWGLSVTEDSIMEPYAESPDGMREVQYFDKSRMEINNPNAFDDGLWFVTNGLLVVEMVEGKIQIGDTEFDESPDPAEINIVGDPADESGLGPTYADIGAFGLPDKPATAEGTTITAVISDDGTVSNDQSYATFGVTAEERVTEEGIDHTVASVFWEFMNSEGIVWENGAYVTENLFENPFYATGYPIAEAYWATALVEGTERDILWQCFERRCLTYTPGNPDGYLVEAGNVGQHYFRWRYETPITPVEVTDQAFYAELTTSQEVPAPGPSDASGDAVVFVDADGNLQFELIVVDIEGVTAAHIHLGMPGVAGPVVVTLFTGQFSTEDDGVGTLATGSISADDLVGELEGLTLGHLLAEMEAGNTYVNVHTVDNPAGEIRGQLELVSDDEAID
ncbi:MAG: CHRD domain-containing protein [Chloroflexota bacterium]|nr:CHRD domain-containing protein [Chloroflexota bacterium]